MTTNEKDAEVPDAVAEALRAAAVAVPGADLHPTGPVLRLQERRRRRRVATALGGVGAVAAVALAVLAVGPAPTGDGQVVLGSTIDDATTSTTTPPTDAAGAPLLMPQAGAELLADGSVRPVPLARPDDGLTDALRLADGRLVTLASRNLQPDVVREDGPFVEDLAFVLAVFDADGTLVREKDIRRIGGYIDLVGERGGKVVLSRSQSLNCCRLHRQVDFSVIDPITFAEEPLVSVDDGHGTAAVGPDLLVAGTDVGQNGDASVPCQLHVVDLSRASGPPLALPLPDCLGIQGVALSPDGGQAAVVAQVPIDDGPPAVLGLALFVVDIEKGQVTTTELLEGDPCAAEHRGMCGPTEFRAVTWIDDSTVDVVVQDPEPIVDGTLEVGLLVPELLRTVTVPLDAGQS